MEANDRDACEVQKMGYDVLEKEKEPVDSGIDLTSYNFTDLLKKFNRGNSNPARLTGRRRSNGSVDIGQMSSNNSSMQEDSAPNGETDSEGDGQHDISVASNPVVGPSVTFKSTTTVKKLSKGFQLVIDLDATDEAMEQCGMNFVTDVPESRILSDQQLNLSAESQELN